MIQTYNLSRQTALDRPATGTGNEDVAEFYLGLGLCELQAKEATLKWGPYWRYHIIRTACNLNVICVVCNDNFRF
jgi:hypothetical protein